jgi:hypothetical protein
MANPKNHQKIHFLNKQLAKNKNTAPLVGEKTTTDGNVRLAGHSSLTMNAPTSLPACLPPSLALPFVCASSAAASRISERLPAPLRL